MLFLGIAVLKLYTGIHHLKRQKKRKATARKWHRSGLGRSNCGLK